jgi:hypothetical protein
MNENPAIVAIKHLQDASSLPSQANQSLSSLQITLHPCIEAYAHCASNKKRHPHPSSTSNGCIRAPLSISSALGIGIGDTTKESVHVVSKSFVLINHHCQLNAQTKRQDK